MTLLGPSLSKLFKQCGRRFQVSTQIRVGTHILYGIKQLHEVRFRSVLEMLDFSSFRLALCTAISNVR